MRTEIRSAITMDVVAQTSPEQRRAAGMTAADWALRTANESDLPAILAMIEAGRE